MTGIRRPFVLLGGSAYAALTAAALFGASAAGVLGCVCAGLGLPALGAALGLRLLSQKREKKGERPLGRPARGPFLTLFAAGSLTAALLLFLFVRAWNVQAPALELSGQKVRIHGVVLDYPVQSHNRSYYLVKADRVTVDGRTRELPGYTLRLSTWLPFSCRPCDMVECTVKCTAYPEGGLFSSRNSWLARGVILSASLTDYDKVTVIRGTAAPPRKLAAELRRLLGREFQKRLPGAESALIRAMLIGERDLIPDSDHGNFKKIGLSHMLVISGLHLAVLAGLLSAPLGGNASLRRPLSVLLALAVLGFLALIGFPVSAVRSGVMYILYLLGNALGRQVDSVNSLGMAVLVICLGNPFSGGDLSFALSVFATLGILLLADRISRGLLRSFPAGHRLRRALQPVCRVLGASLAALLFTLPIQALVFGGITLLSPLANLLLILPVSLVLYCGAPAAFLGLLPATAPFSEVFFLAAGWMARIALLLAKLLAALPGTFLDLTSFSALACTLGAALLLWIGSILRRGSAERKAVTAVAAAGSLLLSCTFCLPPIRVDDALTFAVAEDSSCVTVFQKGRAAVLALGGYRTDAAGTLLDRNNIRKLELLCLPVRDSDAREAAASLLEAGRVDRLALPEDAYPGKDLSQPGDTETLFLKEGETVTLWDGVTVTSSHAMGRLTVAYGAAHAVIERGGPGEGTCELLFTDRTDSGTVSAFTVLQNDAIITEDGPTELPPGRYLTPTGDGLYLRLYPDGRVRI